MYGECRTCIPENPVRLRSYLGSSIELPLVPKPYLWIGYFKRKMRYLAPQRP